MPLMHRLTARFLLILLLVGSFAHVGLAVSTPPPHACSVLIPRGLGEDASQLPNLTSLVWDG